ncbi:hypothetical protein COLO4_09829 [Corchorus olitorius]|uniref:Uncharacterized protein n=1 Tax=Corchorus olitorius TaxID=93759 RepID=A0A1R3KAU6_9ROSI|nr:hypothetical protein COLO4_09829 [Corchorus olitorius]
MGAFGEMKVKEGNGFSEIELGELVVKIED